MDDDLPPGKVMIDATDPSNEDCSPIVLGAQTSADVGGAPSDENIVLTGLRCYPF